MDLKQKLVIYLTSPALFFLLIITPSFARADQYQKGNCIAQLFWSDASGKKFDANSINAQNGSTYLVNVIFSGSGCGPNNSITAGFLTVFEGDQVYTKYCIAATTGFTSGQLPIKNSNKYSANVLIFSKGQGTCANLSPDHTLKIFAQGVDSNNSPTAPGSTVVSNTPPTVGNVAPTTNAATGPSGALGVDAPNYDESNSSLIPLIKYTSVTDLIVALIKLLLTAIGTLSVVMILYAAFRLVTSQGNATAITAARTTITWAILGLVTALLSYSIVAVLQSLLGAK